MSEACCCCCRRVCTYKPRLVPALRGLLPAVLCQEHTDIVESLKLTQLKIGTTHHHQCIECRKQAWSEEGVALCQQCNKNATLCETCMRSDRVRDERGLLCHQCAAAPVFGDTSGNLLSLPDTSGDAGDSRCDETKAK